MWINPPRTEPIVDTIPVKFRVDGQDVTALGANEYEFPPLLRLALPDVNLKAYYRSVQVCHVVQEIGDESGSSLPLPENRVAILAELTYE